MNATSARVLILSDTHVRDAARLPAPLLLLAERADHIIHAGDLIDMEVVRVLQQFAEVTAVHGNVDGMDVVHQLPEESVVEVAGLRIGVRHIAGARSGRHARLAAMLPDCDIRVYGHTHEPDITQLDDGSWVLNPGSPTQRRSAPHHTVIWLDIQHSVARPELIRIDEMSSGA